MPPTHGDEPFPDDKKTILRSLLVQNKSVNLRYSAGGCRYRTRCVDELAEFTQTEEWLNWWQAAGVSKIKEQ